MSELEHKPLPYRTAEGSYGHYVAVLDADGKTVCLVPWGGLDGGTAAYIARACNLFPALVKALECMIDIAKPNASEDDSRKAGASVALACAILAQARGRE